jgi:monofunctional biosynthetic peptidoglycan transglycosylase
MKKMARFISKVALGFFIGSILWVLLYRFVPVPLTFLMLQRCVEQKLAGKELHMKHTWVSSDNISNKMELAVFCSEDQNFLWHWGIDFNAIDKAVKYNEKQQKRKRSRFRGASTITQQCAKNVFLWPARSFIRKGFEVYFTFLIELFWSKERIMEVYLNSIEMGDGIYGVEAAAQTYFHHSAKKLSAVEAASIAAILPNPRKWNPTKPTAFLLRRQAWIMGQMNSWGGKFNYEMDKPKVK